MVSLLSSGLTGLVYKFLQYEPRGLIYGQFKQNMDRLNATFLNRTVHRIKDGEYQQIGKAEFLPDE